MLLTEPLVVGERTSNHMGAEDDAGAEAWSMLLTEAALLVGVGLAQKDWRCKSWLDGRLL